MEKEARRALRQAQGKLRGVGRDESSKVKVGTRKGERQILLCADGQPAKLAQLAKPAKPSDQIALRLVPFVGG